MNWEDAEKLLRKGRKVAGVGWGPTNYIRWSGGRYLSGHLGNPHEIPAPPSIIAAAPTMQWEER